MQTVLVRPRVTPHPTWGYGVLLHSLLERYAQTRAIARCVRLLGIIETRT
jgi:hypothetical protein